MTTTHKVRGFSLIELMISMALAVLVLIFLLSVFANASRSYHQDQMQSRMQSNARFALKYLVDEISMFGFFGHEAARTSTASAITLTSDCGPSSESWALDLSAPVVVNTAMTAAAANESYGCIEASAFSPGTDILSIKRVVGEPLTRDAADSSDANHVFFRTGFSSTGTLALYDGSEVLGDSQFDWQYSANVYYIRNESLIGSADGVPSLYRKSLQGLSVTETNGGVARGIERFRIVFGIDNEALDGNSATRPDGIPNYFTSTPSTDELEAVVSARVFVLARSIQPVNGYTNNKTYILGDLNLGNFNDNYYRRVFSTTVRVRNPVLQSHVRALLPG